MGHEGPTSSGHDANAEDAWEAAERALEEARQITGGAERIEALRRAGKLRFEADKLRRAADNKRVKI